MLNVATYVLDKIAHHTFACAQECARALARHKQCSVGHFVCDNSIAHRDFMISLSYLYSFNNSHFLFLQFEIKKFIQPFANFIKGAHSYAHWCAILDGRAAKIAHL